VPADANGRLLVDMEGGPLAADYVAGRRVVSGPDEPLEATELAAAATKGTGREPEAVAANKIGGDAGRLVKTTDRRSGRSDYHLFWDRRLTPAQGERVRAHELAHLIDDMAGRITQDGVKAELRAVYNDLNNPELAQARKYKPDVDRASRSVLRNYGPEHQGYSGAQADNELVAEAIRAYMADPNYLKSVAPNVAKAIRAAVNDHPTLSKIIQFNTVAGLPGGRALSDAGEQKQ
jgi:hypothetical protein